MRRPGVESLAAYNLPMLPGPLIALIPFLAAGFALAWVIALPAAIRRGFWIRPKFATLPLDEGLRELNRPELVAACDRLDRLAEQLQMLGYHETQRLLAPDVASRCTLMLLLARDHRTETMAGVQLVWHGSPSDPKLELRGEYFGFETPLVAPDGQPLTVQTTTSPQLFPAPPSHRLLCVDWIDSLETVHETHRLHCEQTQPTGARPLADADTLPERLTRRHARVMAAAVAAGYLTPVRPGLLQLTGRGAMRIAAQLVWPVAAARRARQRRLTRRQLAAWGVS